MSSMTREGCVNHVLNCAREVIVNTTTNFCERGVAIVSETAVNNLQDAVNQLDAYDRIAAREADEAANRG